MKPASINTRVAEYRERKRDAGMVKLELWLPADLHEVVKKYAGTKLKQSKLKQR